MSANMNLYKFRSAYGILIKLIRYNMKIIFANKFKYFLTAAVIFFLLVTVPDMFDPDENPTEGTVYNLLLFPGLLLVFYPTVFGIQNDVDTRMIEILFGIPNYRYKVWLVRLAMIYLVVYFMLLVLGILSSLLMVDIPVFRMVFHLMFPIFFLGCLAFMFSGLVRSGNGTAVIMVVIGLAFWISVGFLSHSRWNIFLNPFHMPSEVNRAIWVDIVLKNRIYMAVGTVLALLMGLYNLQKRERFV